MRVPLVLLCIIISAVVSLSLSLVAVNYLSNKEVARIMPSPTPVPTPLSRYKIESLESANILEGKIEIGRVISEEEDFTSYLFTYFFDPAVNTGETKHVSGQINIPNQDKEFPLILMARGYIDQSVFETGMGTRPSAAYYAKNGFITLAPDFLGYGESSTESADIFETRFQTYTTFVSLINSLNAGFANSTKNSIKWNGRDLFIWGHSNGGQIALSALAITGRKIPTTLWAPVTKPFPYSILYFTDESEDHGKFIRHELSEFERVYDAEQFSFTNYLDRISAPVQIHQGGADSAVPSSWSDNFAAMLRGEDKNVEYFYYPGADHNMRPVWDTVVARDVDFFMSFIEN